MKTSVYIATSFDGFIAREDGSLDWLPGNDGESDESEDYGYSAFIASVDALVMGRHTFEMVMSFGGWHYGDTPVIVLSSRPDDIGKNLPRTVEVHHWSSREAVDHLAARGYQHLYIDGGVTIQGFLQTGLLDEIIVTRVPILLGRGIPLFGPLLQDIKLEHVETTAYESGMVQSCYRIPK